MAESLILVMSVGAIVLLMLSVRRQSKGKDSNDSGLFAFKVDIGGVPGKVNSVAKRRY